jgi:hypothetical protein
VGFRYEKSVARPAEIVLVPNKIPPYVVLGIFAGADGIPNERIIPVKKPSLQFWYFFWTYCAYVESIDSSPSKMLKDSRYIRLVGSSLSC